MTEEKWLATLSTTEPYNNIGLIKLRRNNENSEVMRVRLTKNSKLYDLTALKVFFVTHFSGKDGLKVPIQKEAKVIDTKEGIVEFIFDQDCMQKVGRQEAYFEIYDYDKFLDTTQNFTYEIIRSSRQMKADFTPYIETWEEAEKMLDEGTAFNLNRRVENLGLIKANIKDVNQQNEKVLLEVSKKANQDYVDAQLSAIVSGTPKETFTTLKELENKYPSGAKGVFLVTENGYWYYWNDISKKWTDGGVYQGLEVGFDTITGRNVVANSLTAKDTNFLTESSNLFNKEKRVKGKYIGLNGVISDSVNYDISNFITVDGKELYFYPEADNGVFKDKNGVFISSFKSINPVEIPRNATFLQFSMKKENSSIQQVNYGTSKLTYERHHQELAEEVKVRKDSIGFKSVDSSKLSDLEVVVTSKNLLNPKNVAFGYYSYISGDYVNSTTMRSILITGIKPNTVYSKNFAQGWDVTFWDEYDKFVTGLSTNGEFNFSTPNNKYIYAMRVSIPQNVNIDDSVVKEGQYVPGFYDKYQEKIIFKGIELKEPIENSFDEEKSRADINLFIETYFEGGNQPYHPSVISFKEPWNYYRYWMAYTPLPFGDEDNENPCIAVSSDMINWTTRPAQVNPIDDLSDGTQTYWSDTELVFNDVNNRLECWYRGYKKETNQVTICRKTTSDGVNWSGREVIKVFENSNGHVSPTVIFENGKYKIWLLEPCLYFETTDLSNWGTPKTYSLSHKKWHGQVKKVKDKYIYILSGGYGEGTIDYYISDDEVNFKFVSSIIKSSKELGYKNLSSIDGIGFYRPCFIYENDKFYVFYSTVANNNSRGVTLSFGDDLENLKGIDSSYLSRMSKPTRKSFYGLEGTIFDETENSLNFCTKPSTTKKIRAEWIKI